MTEYEAFIRDAASKRGIDPDIAVRVANSEGSVTEPARLGDFSGPPWFSGKSWWPFQLHYGGQDPADWGARRRDYRSWGSTAGMGNHFTYLTGWEPGDPAAWRDSVRYALNRAKAGGWTPWYGAAHVGIGRWDGIDRNHPWDAGAEPWDYEKEEQPVSTLTYNPDAPVDIQPDDWSCSVEATQWLLRSIGRNPQDSWLRPAMLGRNIVSTELGLLDATGTRLAHFLQAEYGDEMGLTFYAIPDLTWNELWVLAGKQPVLIGGRAWNHWSGVRRPFIDIVELANPAPTWKGVGTELDRDEFNRWGPWSAVTVKASARPVPTDPRDARIKELEGQVNSLVSTLGYLTHDVAEALQAAVNTLRAHKP